MGLLKSNLITLAGGVSTPTGDPTLKLDLEFSSMTALPASVTFTRASVATYFDQNGVLQTALANAARFDHDPVTLEPLGLLIEEARTNLCLQSGQIGSTTGGAWNTGGGLTIALNSIVAPDGTLTGTLETNTGASSYIRAVRPVSENADYTFSFWAKKGTSTGVGFAVYNMTGGVFVVPTTNYLALLNGDAWTRISVNFTTPPGCVSVGVYPDSNLGGGGTVYLWGAQLEGGANPTSYIATTAAAATRAVEAASMTGANFSNWYNAPTGTFCIAARSTAKPASGSTQYVFTFGADGTNFQNVNLYSEVVVYLGAYTVSAQPSITIGTIAAKARFQAAFNYVEGDKRGSLNGAGVVSDAYTLGPATKLSFGATQTGSVTGGLAVASLKYYNVAKSDAELIELTTP